MTDIQELFGRLRQASELPVLAGAGVYIFCLQDIDALAPIAPGRRGLIYVGMTDQGLDVRNHFLHVHSGFSTFRRSLGALLKDRLRLKAIPRAPGPSRTNVVNFKFDEPGEQALSRWMTDNLLSAQMTVEDGALAREKELISKLEPPLNLTGWSNRQARAIKDMRAVCVREASA